MSLSSQVALAEALALSYRDVGAVAVVVSKLTFTGESCSDLFRWLVEA